MPLKVFLLKIIFNQQTYFLARTSIVLLRGGTTGTSLYYCATSNNSKVKNISKHYWFYSIAIALDAAR
jgi:hypothetical protein